MGLGALQFTMKSTVGVYSLQFGPGALAFQLQRASSFCTYSRGSLCSA